MKKAELVFLPLPAVSHLVPVLEFGRLLVDRDDRFSITVLIMNMPLLGLSAVNNYIHSLPASVSGRIRFVHLPQPDSQSASTSIPKELSPTYLLSMLLAAQKPLVRDAVKQLVQSESTRLAGLVSDMLCTSLLDVADELGVPSYVFFTASASFLGLMSHLLTLYDNQGVDASEMVDSDAELVVPSFVNPVPARVLPSVVGEKQGGYTTFLNCLRRFTGLKGIMVNTTMELESYAINSFVDYTLPPIYPVGPILNLKRGEHVNPDNTYRDIMNWLDDQPPSSVVFLCFGSIAFFPPDQVEEIAHGLECSGHRFLWSLRQPPPKGEIGMLRDYTNFDEVLPQGFLDRTAGIGKVIGWAPQVDILAHPSVGGFVFHCGWNSVLESLWYGVPIAAWPIYADHHLNAFQTVKELGLAVEITLDYKNDNGRLVSAKEVENGIRSLMNNDSEIKGRVKKMKENMRNALNDGGSSHACLTRLIEDMITNIA